MVVVDGFNKDNLKTCDAILKLFAYMVGSTLAAVLIISKFQIHFDTACSEKNVFRSK